jgi:hypothetical protein
MHYHSRTIKSIAALFFIILLLTTGAYSDCQVTLQWDPNDPAPAGYRLYGREAGRSYNYDEPWWEGDQSFTQCTIEQLDETTTYYFVVRAYDAEDNESGDSNEVVFSYDGSSDTSSNMSDTDTSNTGSSGGGGGGGGCFINSLINP